MHGSPPCTIHVTRFAAWRVAVATVAIAALASLLAWLAGSPLAANPWVRGGVGVAGLACLGLAASLWRQSPVRLGWDGTAWTMACDDGKDPESSGRLEVAIDLGSFLLLRFLPGDGSKAAVRWIPVGRAGLERDWHVFRCAVHSPLPAAGLAPAEPRQP